MVGFFFFFFLQSNAALFLSSHCSSSANRLYAHHTPILIFIPTSQGGKTSAKCSSHYLPCNSLPRTHRDTQRVIQPHFIEVRIDPQLPYRTKKSVQHVPLILLSSNWPFCCMYIWEENKNNQKAPSTLINNTTCGM